MSAERIYAGSCRKYGDHIFIAIAGLTALSFAAFLFEAVRLGYVPFLLRGCPMHIPISISQEFII